MIPISYTILFLYLIAKIIIFIKYIPEFYSLRSCARQWIADFGFRIQNFGLLTSDFTDFSISYELQAKIHPLNMPVNKEQTSVGQNKDRRGLFICCGYLHLADFKDKRHFKNYELRIEFEIRNAKCK